MGYEAEKQFYEAFQTLNSGEINASFDLFLANTETHPSFAKNFHYAGLILFSHYRDHEAAERFFQKAVELAPGKAESYIEYARLLLETRRFAEANANLNKAAAVDSAPQDRLYFSVGMLNEAQGMFSEAVNHYRRSLLASFDSVQIDAAQEAIRRIELKLKFQ